MTQVEIEVAFNEHENQIKSLKHRMNEAEADIKDIKELVTSVKLLAQKQDTIVGKLDSVEKKVSSLELAPAETMNKIKSTAITAIVTALVCGAIGALIVFV